MDSVELILVVFEHESQAKRVLASLKTREKKGKLQLFNAAVLSRNAQGVTTVSEDRDLKAGRGALFGAIVGGLIGLLSGPAGVVVGAAAGATTGGLAAGKTDLGFSDRFLDELSRALHPGRSALLLLVEYPWVERVVQALEGQQRKIFRHALRSELVERLSQEQ
jgi:uncharacterized membrane protein